MRDNTNNRQTNQPAHGRHSKPSPTQKNDILNGIPSVPNQPRAFSPVNTKRKGRGAAPSNDINDYRRGNYSHTKKKSKKDKLWNFVSIVLLLIALGCFGYIGLTMMQYANSSQQYESISNDAGGANLSDVSLDQMTIDWDKLKSQNPDTVGWIFMPGTNINYPIVQGEDDEKYLHTDFNGNANGWVQNGCIFLSSQNSSFFTDDANFIYGHNMNDGSMFGQLAKSFLESPDFNKLNTFYILTPQTNYKVNIYAVDVVDATRTDILKPNFSTDEDKASYIQKTLDEAKHKNDAVDPTGTDRLFALITCGDDYATTRMVVYGCLQESARAQ